MDAITGVLGTLGNVFGKIGSAAGTGAGGGGVLGAASPLFSLMGMINQYSLASKEKAAMDRANYYAKNPAALNALVARYQKPLSSGLTSSVSNVVNANLAEQGLSQAPGIQSQVLSQALAPYQQNEQQMAITEAFKALGLPVEALGAIQSTQRNPFSAGGPWPTLGGGSGTQPNIPYPFPSIPQPPDPYGGIGSIPGMTPPFDPTQPLPGTGGETGGIDLGSILGGG